MNRFLALLVVITLGACAPGAMTDVPQRRASTIETLPPMKAFAVSHVQPPARSNTDIARDFLDLEFQMESGRVLPALTRFKGPITIALTGNVPPSAGTDLNRLLQRFRSEAGLTLHRVEGTASITVEFLPRATMQSVVPQAACFVVPRVSSWEAYRADRRAALVDWATVTQREKVAIFIPTDTSPQEVRDCLHEEIAQALGPLNDLYRLPDSVFNDDNFHTVLTGFDMLILRLHYAPELRNGMTKAEVAARLPALLARMNPAGERIASVPPGPTPRAWIDALETALGPRTAQANRRSAALRALAIAQEQGWDDNRLAFSYFAVGRLSLSSEIETAINAFGQAARIYRSQPGTQIHAAHVDMQMAAFALSSGQAEQALALANRSLTAVSDAENAALLATLLMIKAQALELLGRPSEARAVRLDSLGWARYGFGSDEQVRTRLSEIAVLTPRVGKATAL